ncbi:DUF4820 domain-containing protein [Roseomonas sp. 18066]|nr:DUF4820 domain-containing protein [Roseomonas sp. 18066]
MPLPAAPFLFLLLTLAPRRVIRAWLDPGR